MPRFEQVGFTAARDPLTGAFLAAVPLYIDTEERETSAAQVTASQLRRVLMASNPFSQYMEQIGKAKTAEGAQKVTA